MFQALFHLLAFRKRLLFIYNYWKVTMDLSQRADFAKSIVEYDIHSFCCVFLDNINTKLRNTPFVSRISDFFHGKYKSFIVCLRAPYKSSRVEGFYDLQLVVWDFASLKTSFENIPKRRFLIEKNKDKTDRYGEQDVKMGVEYVELPKVLMIQLCPVRFRLQHSFSTEGDFLFRDQRLSSCEPGRVTFFD